MNSVKVLFDSQYFLSKEEEKPEIIILDRIVDINGKKIVPSPTITIHLSKDIREKQKKLFAQYNRVVFKGSRKKQEAEIKSDKLMYAQHLVDLCVKQTTGLFEKHDNVLLKEVFINEPTFMDYIISEMTKVFEGSIKLAEEQEEEDEKN